tara:strand:+ start:179 stop:775 length:597 start_codon:yes stop_codon:yes gene_type:complete
MGKWCIVVQGPSDCVPEIRKATEGYKTIFSAWVGEESCYSKEDDVIFNEKPEEAGTGNLFYQQKTTMSGLLKAQELGFENVLKIRSDFIVKDIDRLINSFTHQLNFFFWHNYNGGYICDYLMAGKTELIISLWKIKSGKYYMFSERMITENFFEMGLNKDDFIFFLNSLNKKNNIFWTKYKKFLSSYKSDNLALNFIK